MLSQHGQPPADPERVVAVSSRGAAVLLADLPFAHLAAADLLRVQGHCGGDEFLQQEIPQVRRVLVCQTLKGGLSRYARGHDQGHQPGHFQRREQRRVPAVTYLITQLPPAGGFLAGAAGQETVGDVVGDLLASQGLDPDDDRVPDPCFPVTQAFVEGVPASDHDWCQIRSGVGGVQGFEDAVDRLRSATRVLGDFIEAVEDRQDRSLIYQCEGDARGQMVGLSQPVNQPIGQGLITCPSGYAYRHRHLWWPLIPAADTPLN